MCVGACVRACVRACVCVCVRVCVWGAGVWGGGGADDSSSDTSVETNQHSTPDTILLKGFYVRAKLTHQTALYEPGRTGKVVQRQVPWRQGPHRWP